MTITGSKYLHLMRVDAAQIGYGRMGVNVEKSLRALGYEVSTSQDDPPAGTVLHCSTPAHLLRYRAGQRLVLNTMWETTHLPEAMREILHLFDTILVPSVQNLELFGEFHPDVHYVPLGIDPERWKPTLRTPPTHRFEFLIGGSGVRKGPDLAYKAFRAAFPEGSWDGPTPWLTFKSPNPSPFFGQNISQVNGKIPAEDEIALYERAHCYLQPSRGEGFGLQPLQAIAQGLPTILTAAHGHASFAEYGIPIDSQLVPTIPGSFMFGEAGDWWEPDVDQLAEKMRWVYDNYNIASTMAWSSAQVVHETFTWDNTARAMMTAIGPLSDYTGPGDWVTPEIKLYRIVLNRHHAAEVAGAAYRWEPFTDYWVSSDLKRILFEGGFLDPSCVFGDSGLLKEQVEASGLLSGAESFCGTCNQRLGTQPTRADVLYAEMQDGRV